MHTIILATLQSVGGPSMAGFYNLKLSRCCKLHVVDFIFGISWSALEVVMIIVHIFFSLGVVCAMRLNIKIVV